MSEQDSKQDMTVAEPTGTETSGDGPAAESPSADTQAPEGDAESPMANLKQGLGLLWQAAVGTANEIKQEIDRSGASDTLQQAGRDLENAANQAARTLEQFIEKVQPKAPEYSKEWPGAATGETQNDSAQKDAAQKDAAQKDAAQKDAAQKNAAQKSADDPENGAEKDAEDGGETENGERRDMRIQVEDDE